MPKVDPSFLVFVLIDVASLFTTFYLSNVTISPLRRKVLFYTLLKNDQNLGFHIGLEFTLLTYQRTKNCLKNIEDLS